MGLPHHPNMLFCFKLFATCPRKVLCESPPKLYLAMNSRNKTRSGGNKRGRKEAVEAAEEEEDEDDAELPEPKRPKPAAQKPAEVLAPKWSAALHDESMKCLQCAKMSTT